MTCAAAALLSSEFTGTTLVLASFFGLVCALALVAQILFDVQVENMVIWLDGIDLVIERSLASGLLTIDVINVDFHYFLIKTVEPLQPATEPFTRMRLCSGMIFNTDHNF